MTSRHHGLRKRCAVLATVAGALWSGGVAVRAAAQQRDYPRAAGEGLEMTAEDPRLQQYWEPLKATLAQDLWTTSGHLQIRSKSAQPPSVARFYAEYYDEKGRWCFSLPFSQDTNLDRIDGSFLPGQARTLMSGAQLAPAVKPKSVRLYAVSESAATPLGWTPPGIYVPATIMSGWVSEPDLVELEGNLDEPVIPLALAKATVDKGGTASATQVLAARDRRERDWFATFVAGLRFVPATRGGTPVVSDTLVLIRAVQESPSVLYWPADDDRWVKQYISELKTDDLPFVNKLYFLPANKLRPGTAPAQANLFEYLSVGTGWGINVLHGVADSGGRMILDWYRGDDHPERDVPRK